MEQSVVVKTAAIVTEGAEGCDGQDHRYLDATATKW
jgi:hypothetical protein